MKQSIDSPWLCLYSNCLPTFLLELNILKQHFRMQYNNALCGLLAHVST